MLSQVGKLSGFASLKTLSKVKLAKREPQSATKRRRNAMLICGSESSKQNSIPNLMVSGLLRSSIPSEEED